MVVRSVQSSVLRGELMSSTHGTAPAPTASTDAPGPSAPSEPAPTGAGGGSALQQLAKDHLWMHFTRMGSYADAEVPVIVRGEGCYVYDEHGRRYLDGLSALYCV